MVGTKNILQEKYRILLSIRRSFCEKVASFVFKIQWTFFIAYIHEEV